jgi:hypothetical protein
MTQCYKSHYSKYLCILIVIAYFLFSISGSVNGCLSSELDKNTIGIEREVTQTLDYEDFTTLGWLTFLFYIRTIIY